MYVGFNFEDVKSFKGMYVHFCNNMHSKKYSHLIFTELHRIIQHQGPLEEFKQLYSHLSHTKSSPRYVDSSFHALLFR